MKQLITQSQGRQFLLEPALIAIVFGLCALMGYLAVETPVLLHLFYVPVVATGSLHGRSRARMMALFCILTSLIIFVPNLRAGSTDGVPLMTLAVFLLWGTTLILIANIVGSLSENWRSAMAELTENHKKDVLTDSLTGVANHRAYEFELSRRIADWNRNGTPLSLIFIDIDYFKKFNDRFGHQAGDAVLRAVAEIMRKTIRETDLVARYGGEEFALVLSGVSVEESKEIAERVRYNIESARFPFNGLILQLTISSGFAQILSHEDKIDFVQRADAALYSSKEAGRNCVHYHDGRKCHQFGDGMATEITALETDKKQGRASSDPYTDESTGLPSQKVFLEELRRRAAERSRYGTKLSLAVVECVEDLSFLAHDAHVRKTLVATISKLASSVLRGTDLVARSDSNSLSILLPVTDLENALVPLCRLCENASNYSDPKYGSLNYAVSIGAIEVDADEHPGAALKRVQAALQSARAKGGNCVYIHDGTECQPVARAIPAESIRE